MEKRIEQRPLVSVCISVHNTEKWLPRCLDSVVNQTLDNLEIVLVNNGSTDGSERIMKEYRDKYTSRKFVIVTQEDRGLAQGRQSGVCNSTGQYITFLDADDYVSLEAYEEMYNCAVREDVDIVEIQTLRKGKVLSSGREGKMNTKKVLEDFFYKRGILYMVWTRLYKRELFANQPVFPDLYTNNEDNFATPCLLYTASTIFFLNKPFHTYSDDNESAVTTKLLNDKKLNRKLFAARTAALHSILFIKDFIGNSFEAELLPAFESYKYSYIYDFVFQKNKRISLAERLNVITDLFDFKDNKSVIDYLMSKMEHKTNFYKMCSLIGFKNAFLIWQQFN